MSLEIFKNRLDKKDYQDINKYYNYLMEFLINKCLENEGDLETHTSIVKIKLHDYIYRDNADFGDKIYSEIGAFDNWSNKVDNYIINLLDNDRRFLLTGCGNKNILVKYDVIKNGRVDE